MAVHDLVELARVAALDRVGRLLVAEALATIARAGRGVVVVLGDAGTSCADRADAGPLAQRGEVGEVLAALGVTRTRFLQPIG